MPWDDYLLTRLDQGFLWLWNEWGVHVWQVERGAMLGWVVTAVINDFIIHKPSWSTWAFGVPVYLILLVLIAFSEIINARTPPEAINARLLLLRATGFATFWRYLPFVFEIQNFYFGWAKNHLSTIETRWALLHGAFWIVFMWVGYVLRPTGPRQKKKKEAALPDGVWDAG